MNKIASYLTFIVLSGFVLCALLAAGQQEQQPSEFQLHLPILPKAKAQSPVPPQDAHAKSDRNTIGEGNIKLTTGGPASYWEEEIHMGGDTTMVITEFMHDPRQGILYAFRHGDFTCAGDKTMHGRLLEALHTEGNKRGAPVGSGWYAVELNAGECGVKRAGIYGCKFTADGQTTECGHASFLGTSGELQLTPLGQQ